jgi:hypothetical protein
MRGSWLQVVDSVLRPARPHLDRCVAEGERHLAARRVVGDERTRALRDCENRIEMVRAAVFAAGDGVITMTMTDLEREWRKLARLDNDRGLMDLWSSIAPERWLDQKRWRDADDPADVAIALAADVDGVEAAESAVAALRTALSPWHTLGARVRWQMLAAESFGDPADVSGLTPAASQTLFAGPLLVAMRDDLFEHARAFESEVREAMLHRHPDHPLLARDVGHAALLDCMWNAADLGPSPVLPLCDLWKTGYVISGIDETGVTLGIPAIV